MFCATNGATFPRSGCGSATLEICRTERPNSTTIELRWGALLGANEYQIEMATGRDAFQLVGKVRAPQTFYGIGDVGKRLGV